MGIKKDTILIFRSAGLGDFILAVPALALARKIFFNKKIILLTTFSGNSNQRNLVLQYLSQNKGEQARPPWLSMVSHLVDESIFVDNLSKLSNILHVRDRLKNETIKIVLMFIDPCSPWIGRLKKWIMLKIIAGFFAKIYGWKGRGSLNNNKKKLYENNLLNHHVYGPLQFVKEMSLFNNQGENEISFDLRLNKHDEKWAHKWLKINKINKAPIVAIAPGSVHNHKQWPLESYKKLIQMILSSYKKTKVIVIGSQKDMQLGEILLEINKQRVFNLAGLCSISQSGAIIKRCNLLVGNDGGAIHLGDAMGCKVISIISGIEYPGSIEPWNNQRLVVRNHVACSPCYNFNECPELHNECVKGITVEQVFEKCKLVLC